MFNKGLFDLINQQFFSHILFRAKAFLFGTAVVHVSFLKLRRNGASARAAFDKSIGESVLVFFHFVRSAAPPHHFLRLIKQFFGNERLVLAFMLFAFESENAVVHGVHKNLYNHAYGKFFSLLGLVSLVIDDFCNMTESIVSGDIQIKDFPYHVLLGIVFQNGVRFQIINISLWRFAGQFSSAELLPQAALYIL